MYKSFEDPISEVKFMKRTAMPTILILLALSAILTTSALADSLYGYLPGRLVVEFSPGFQPTVDKAADGLVINDAGLQELSDRFGGQELEQLFPNLKYPNKSGAAELQRQWIVIMDERTNLDEAAAAYGALNGVSKVWKDAIHYQSIAVPNDPNLGQQWYLRNQTYGGKDLRWMGGWAEAQGDSNIVIAIIDSGVDWQHPDLGGTNADFTDGAIKINWDEYYGTPGSDDDGNGKVDDIRGWDFVLNGTTPWPGEDATFADNDPMDFGGHGTGCSGCVAAITNNGTGISGTAGGCKIMALRAGWLMNDGGDPAGVVGMVYASQAITYAVDNGANLINCSWGSSSYLLSSLLYAYNNGVQVVNAAGNDNDSVAETLDTHPSSISVAALNSDDTKSSFSNYGSWVEVAAPGNNIHTTYYDYTTSSSVYISVDGTSFASPIICGTIALIWSANPGLTLSEAVDLMYDTCDDLDAANPGYVGQLGAGRPNLLTALGDHFQEVPGEFADIFDAVNEAAPGDTIAIAASHAMTGPYSFNDKPLYYLGGYDASYVTRDPIGTPTVITGSPSSTAASVVAGAPSDVVIDGFRFTGGGGQYFSGIPYAGDFGGGATIYGDALLRNIDVTGNVTANAFDAGGGGGLLILNASPTLENVTVHGNSAVYGSGIYINGGAPTLTDCDITDNPPVTDNGDALLGGGLYVTDADLTMSGCTISGHLDVDNGGGLYAANNTGTTTLNLSHNVISGNSAIVAGSGLYMSGGSLTMLGDEISGNLLGTGAGMQLGGGLRIESATADLDSLVIRDNIGVFGGGLSVMASPDFALDASLIFANTGTILGGGLHMENTPVGTITGNTFAYNNAPTAGGGLYLIGSTLTIANTISAFNTGNVSACNGIQSSGSTLILICNDVFGNDGDQYSGVIDPTGSDGNISADPEFCDVDNDDYTITAGSPVLPPLSACGQIGALGEGCDDDVSIEDPGPSPVPLRFAVEPNYPNPFNPMTTIRFSLATPGVTSIHIYDVSGRLVRTVLDEALIAAEHTVEWQGRDDSGHQVAAGVYFYRVRSGENEHVGQMALIK